jgi:hypothetical protein
MRVVTPCHGRVTPMGVTLRAAAVRGFRGCVPPVTPFFLISGPCASGSAGVACADPGHDPREGPIPPGGSDGGDNPPTAARAAGSRRHPYPSRQGVTGVTRPELAPFSLQQQLPIVTST